MALGVTGLILGSIVRAIAEPYTFPSIATPFYIAKKADLNFGNLKVSAIKDGIIIVTPDNNLITEQISRAKIQRIKEQGTAACFTVTGLPDYTYAITLPESCILTDENSHAITANKFTSTPSVTGTLDSNGIGELHVGATFNVFSEQDPGSYTNLTDVAVTINYN